MAKAKEIVGLNCSGDERTAIRLVLLTRLAEMCALRDAALDWSDIEGVHDMRVASRRLRSALQDFRPFLRERVGQQRLRKIARALGGVRDEDVAIVALEKLAAEAPEDIRDGIARIIDERRAKRDAARSVLQEKISETEIAGLLYKLRRGIEDATRRTNLENNGNAASVKDAAHTLHTFRRCGRKVMLSRLEELNQLAESLYKPHAVEQLHDMRIAAKRLRYAMELFAQCWGESLIWFSQEVAHMQSSLGDLHDCDVWIEDFSHRLRNYDDPKAKGQSNDSGSDESAHVRHATIWLLRHFSKERTRHYRRSLERWHEWEKSAFDARLREVLNADASADDTHAAEASPAAPVPTDAQSQPEIS